MNINYYFKATIFIFIYPIFLLQSLNLSAIESRPREAELLFEKKLSQSKLKYKKENFFNYYKINPLSIFIAFENENSNSKGNNVFLLESDEQIENENSFIAKGNVIIEFNGAKLKTDYIKYSKIDNKIISEGNIQYQNNNQFLEADKFEYDITKKTGSIKNVYGLIDVITLTEDLNWESSKVLKKDNISSNITKTRFESNNIIGLTFFGKGKDNEDLNLTSSIKTNSLKKWRFQSPEVLINDQLLSADRASFTNDPFNPSQLTLESYGLRSKRINGKLILISPWTNMNLDQKITIPLARRTIKEDQKNFQKWGFGFDYEDKDGFYVSRNSDSFEFSNIKYRFVNEFYLQRILQDKTNVFRERNSSITSEVVENKINFGDYFGFKFLTKSNLLGYDLDTLTSLNSLNTNRISEAIRHETNLTRVFNFKNLKNINNNIFFVYRNKLDTGYDGIKEIYSSLGTNFYKYYNIKVNNLNINSNIRLQLANFRAEELNGNNLINHNRISSVVYFENKYNLWNKTNSDLFIDNNYKYTPSIINQGLDWVTRLTLTSSIYENHRSQNIIKLEFGPELKLGEFKKKSFNFTSLKAFLGIFEKSGETPFKFDNTNESERIYFELKQQIYGPIALEAQTNFNIDSSSSDFNKFINPRFALSYNRRAYNFELYSIPDRKITGLNFNIFGLGYEGYGKRFKDSF